MGADILIEKLGKKITEVIFYSRAQNGCNFKTLSDPFIQQLLEECGFRFRYTLSEATSFDLGVPNEIQIMGGGEVSMYSNRAHIRLETGSVEWFNHSYRKSYRITLSHFQ